jgi:hypothetical protein
MPYSGHMSNAEWGPPPDSANGPVLLVYQEGDRPTEQFAGCRQVGHVDNGQGVDNEEQNAQIALCSSTVKPWSALWPSLRHFY